MKKTSLDIINSLIVRYPDLKTCQADIIAATNLLIETFQTGHKMLVCGNGGSAADSLHIVGELMKGFHKTHPISLTMKNEFEKKYGRKETDYLSCYLERGLPCISLVNEVALNTAYINDNCADLVFANQVLNLGQKGDTLFAISTSGNSTNIIQALKVASVCGVNTILLTGNDGGMAKKEAKIAIVVPEKETFLIQERHLPIYHAICLCLEDAFFD